MTVKFGNGTFEDEFFISELRWEDIIVGIPWLQNHRPEIIDLLQTMDSDNSMGGGGEISEDQSGEIFATLVTRIAVLELRAGQEEGLGFKTDSTSSGLGSKPDSTPSGLGFKPDSTSSGLGSKPDSNPPGLGFKPDSTPSGLGSKPDSTPSGLGLKPGSRKEPCQEPEPEVRGLTGNKPGWEATIPKKFHRYLELFEDTPPKSLPPHRPGFDCEIRLKEGAKLPNARIIPQSKQRQELQKKLIDFELERGILRSSTSSSAVAAFFVEDPITEGRGHGQLRMVQDYKPINKEMIANRFPIPNIRMEIQNIAGAEVVYELDARGGFSLIRMAEDSIYLTAFITQYGLFEYLCMPMGLSNAPAVFQRLVNHLLHRWLGRNVFCYLDNIYIYGKKAEIDEITHQVLAILLANWIRLKPSKCSWGKEELSFLGFTVRPGHGFRIADDKCAYVQNLPAPKDKADVHHLLGYVQYNAPLVPHLADVMADITDLLKKDAKWEWTEKRQEAFESLKERFRTDLFGQPFDPEKPIRLMADSSDRALGYILLQPDRKREKLWRPVFMGSHKLTSEEAGWTGPDRELYAIIYACRVFHDMILSSPFPVEVLSDHRNLAMFMFRTSDLKSHRGRLVHWYEELLYFPELIIRYIPGKDNPADFPSRYGYAAGSDLDDVVLLPMQRFETKALTDIADWFAKSGVPNIRDRLEKAFATKNHPKDPRETWFLDKLNDSPAPVPENADLNVQMAAQPRNRFLERYRAAHPDASLPEVSEESRTGRQAPTGLGYEGQRTPRYEPRPSFTQTFPSLRKLQ